MRRWYRRLGIALGAVSVCAGAREARAAEPDPADSADQTYLWREPQKPAAPEPSPLQRGWQLSAFTGYGRNTLSQDAAPPETGEWQDLLGFAVGLRARYQLAFGLSLGLRISHHFGAAGDSTQLSLGHLEAGWALPLGPLRGELFVGGGVARTWSGTELCMVDGDCNAVDQSSFGTTLELGLTLAYPFADHYFVAATGEAVVLPGVIGFSGYASVGVAL